MVGWSRRARESSERAAAAAAREKACIDAGCTCYLHVRDKRPTPWLLIVIGLLMVSFWWVPLYFVEKSERDACEKTQTCEICDVTSTGAPYNCRPDPNFGKNVQVRQDANK